MTTASAAIVSATALSPVAFAADSEMDSIIRSVVSVIFDIFRYIGILLLAWAIGMLVLAFKNEDADSKSRSMMMMVVSVALIGIKTLFQSIPALSAYVA